MNKKINKFAQIQKQGNQNPAKSSTHKNTVPYLMLDRRRRRRGEEEVERRSDAVTETRRGGGASRRRTGRGEAERIAGGFKGSSG